LFDDILHGCQVTLRKWARQGRRQQMIDIVNAILDLRRDGIIDQPSAVISQNQQQQGLGQQGKNE
jgi:hypothetical protein